MFDGRADIGSRQAQEKTSVLDHLDPVTSWLCAEQTARFALPE